MSLTIPLVLLGCVMILVTRRYNFLHCFPPDDFTDMLLFINTDIIALKNKVLLREVVSLMLEVFRVSHPHRHRDLNTS